MSSKSKAEKLLMKLPRGEYYECSFCSTKAIRCCATCGSKDGMVLFCRRCLNSRGYFVEEKLVCYDCRERHLQAEDDYYGRSHCSYCEGFFLPINWRGDRCVGCHDRILQELQEEAKLDALHIYR